MENIKEIETLVVENTTGPAADNIATTDENLTVDAMYQQSSLPSLGRQIFSIIPIHGPTGALFNIRKNVSGDFELIRKDVEVYPSTLQSTGITQEAIQDMNFMYGKEAKKVIGKLLRSISNDAENVNTLDFLDNNSVAVADLQLSDSANAETNSFEINQKVNELVLKANSLNQRTYQAFCVIPYAAGAAISALSQYIAPSTVEGKKEERGLFLGQVGQTKFYMNPDATSTMAYVGLKDSENPSKSSGVFSPYQSQIVEATNPETGALRYFIANRYAITASPLHVTNNEMLFKFNVVM